MINRIYFCFILAILMPFNAYAIKPEIVAHNDNSLSIKYKNGDVYTPDFYMLKNWSWYFLYHKEQVFAVHVEKSTQRFYKLNWSSSPTFSEADSNIFKSLKWEIYNSLHSNWDARSKARDELKMNTKLQQAKFGEIIDKYCGKIEYFLIRPPANEQYFTTTIIKLNQGIITLPSDEMIENIACTEDQSIILGFFYGPGSKGNISQGVMRFSAKQKI